MAEFCEACAAELGHPYGDFRDIAKEGTVVLVLCEGCGPIYADPNGNCVSKCLKAGHPGHGGVEDGGPEYEDGPWADGWEERQANKVPDCLTKALEWWDEDVKYMTYGDYGGHNVFDDDPEWVVEARKLLNIKGGD